MLPILAWFVQIIKISVFYNYLLIETNGLIPQQCGILYKVLLSISMVHGSQERNNYSGLKKEYPIYPILITGSMT